MSLTQQPIGALLRPTPVPTASPTDSVEEAVSLMASNHVASLLITQQERLIGIFTERDLLNRVAAEGLMPKEVTLEAVMTPNPETLSVQESLDAAIEMMAGRGYRNVPILDADQRPLGVLRVRQVIGFLSKALARHDVERQLRNNPLDTIGRTAVSEVERRQRASIKQTASIREALKLMTSESVGAVIVEDLDSEICGIFTERDVVCSMSRPSTNLEAPIGTAMTKNPIRMSTNYSVADALSCMHAGRFRHLPVVDRHGRSDGLISIRDILSLLATSLQTATAES